jgi:PAS domain S-box-containing protein
VTERRTGYNPGVRDPIRRWASPAVLACAVLALTTPVAAQESRQVRVLALYVTTPGAAGAAVFESVFQKTLGGVLGSGLDFQSEFIDLGRFSEPDYPPALVSFLQYKYRRLPPDVVVATTEGARQFIERSRAELFPGTPVVFIERVSSAPPAPGMTGIKAVLDLSGTLDLALTLQPKTTRVFVVGGVSEFDRFYERLARQQLQRFAERVTLTFAFGAALHDLRQTVAHLPANSIIYFLTLGQDGAGARFRSTDALDQLSAVANAPIYAWNGVGIGHGVVGGRLYNNEVVAERIAQLALRVLRGEKPENIPVVTVDPNVNQLDRRQLLRWGIPEAAAPTGTAILFRDPGLWDKYKLYIVGASALTFVQTTLIGGLLIQRRRRRRMEVALRESEARFRLVADTAPVMIWTARPDKGYVFFNQRWLSFRGRTVEQEAGAGWIEGIHPDDTASRGNTYSAAFDARQPFNAEFRFRRFDGEYCWVRDTGVPRLAPDGSFLGYIGSCIDISDIKRAEGEMRVNQATLQARNRQISVLFGRLIAAQENERSRIARDLHDDVSQRIAGLSIMMSSLKRRLRERTEQGDVLAALTSMQQSTIGLAEEIRHVSHDLHPSLLQHAGLVTALRMFCAQFEEQHAVSVAYEAADDVAPVDPDAALCLYRIAQEALRNVAKHADAVHVDVMLTRRADGVQLLIGDDGKGFDLAATRAKAGGLGLVSIDERVRLVGGTVRIDTRIRGGTRVQVEIPERSPAAADLGVAG